jgi:hypothetical protein
MRGSNIGSATELAPQFRVGEWVAAPSGLRKIIAQIVEDRGSIGMKGRRLYRLRIDRGEVDSTIEVPEAELELAPAIQPAETASDQGYSTQNWPRQRFHVKYRKNKETNAWTAELSPVACDAVPPMSVLVQERGGPSSDLVAVSLEYDPRADDLRGRPEIWTSLTAKARRIADEVFKGRHPKARVTHLQTPES